MTDLVFIKEQKKPEHPNYKKVCQYCGREFECIRYDAKYCTPLCRVLANKKSTVGKAHIDNTKKIDQKIDPVTEFKKWDFTASLGASPMDDTWKEFRNYLLEQFGWPKSETITFKSVKKLAEAWNKNHRRQITLSKQLVKDEKNPKWYTSRIIFFVN